MDKDLIAFLATVIIGYIVLAISVAYLNNNNSSVAKVALENGYCSSVSPINRSEVIWSKCEKETNP